MRSSSDEVHEWNVMANCTCSGSSEYVVCVPRRPREAVPEPGTYRGLCPMQWAEMRKPLCLHHCVSKRHEPRGGGSILASCGCHFGKDGVLLTLRRVCYQNQRCISLQRDSLLQSRNIVAMRTDTLYTVHLYTDTKQEAAGYY